MESRTLIALARAAGVSFEWLATGGYGALADPDTRYPSRAQAIAAARIVSYSPAAIAAIRAVDNLPVDPGVDYWLTLLRAKELEHAKLPRLLLAPDESGG